MLTVYPIRLSFIFGYLLVSAPHICKSTLFNSYFFFFLLQRTGVPPPRFPLVSFCRYCFVPAVFLRFRFKNRTCCIHAPERMPLQSLSGCNLPYTCTYLLHTAVTGYGRKIIHLVLINITYFKQFPFC